MLQVTTQPDLRFLETKPCLCSMTEATDLSKLSVAEKIAILNERSPNAHVRHGSRLRLCVRAGRVKKTVTVCYRMARWLHIRRMEFIEGGFLLHLPYGRYGGEIEDPPLHGANCGMSAVRCICSDVYTTGLHAKQIWSPKLTKGRS